MNLLDSQQTLSPPGGLLHALAKIQFTDLNAISGQENDVTLQAYLETHKVLLEQVCHTNLFCHLHQFDPTLGALKE